MNSQDKLNEALISALCESINIDELDESKIKLTESTNIISNEGQFYIGDPCYVLGDDLYYGTWDKIYGFEDGVINCGEFSFIVHGTAYGDGEYSDEQGRIYGVDSGTIALVPIELCKDKSGLSDGTVIKGKEGHLAYEDGKFYITVDHQFIVIDTDPVYYAEDEDNEDEFEEEKINGKI